VARTFVAASSQVLTGSLAPVVAVPLTIAGWYKPTNISSGANQGILTIDDNTTTNFFGLRMNNGGSVCATCSPSGSATAGTMVNGTWGHMAAVFASTTSRTAYFNGVAGTADTSSQATSSALTKTHIGAVVNVQFAGGDIAEVAVWNVALDAFEIAALAKGVSPLMIRPSALVGYWPIIGNFSPEIDPKGRNELTVTGATVAPHCRIYWPSSAPAFAPNKAASTDITFTINGTDYTRYVSRYESETVDISGQTPNTASLMVRGFTPTVGMQVTIREGGVRTLFDGVVTNVVTVQRRNGTRLRYRLECTDWTFLLDRRLVTKAWTATSISTIVSDILAAFAPTFTYAQVQSGLTSIDFSAFLEPVSSVLSRLADAAGAKWKVLPGRIIYFRTTSNLTNPTDLTVGLSTYKRLQYHKKIDQIRTRVLVTGKSTSANLHGFSLAAGATRIPVHDASFFESGGGSARLAAEIVSYSARAVGGTGSKVVGPLSSPGTPTASKTSSGGGIQGTVAYKCSFVSADGESELSSASGNVTGSTVTAPNTTCTFTGNTGGNLVAAVYDYYMSYVTSTGESDAGPIGSPTYGGGTTRGDISNIPTSGDSRVLSRRLWRSKAGGGGTKYFLGNINDNTTTTFADIYNDTSLGSATMPTVNTTGDTGSLTNIPTGAAGTTARRIYRTQAGGSTYFYAGQIANNTTTTYTDTKFDSQLGNQAPDFSQVTTLAGATALRVRDTAQFLSGGGFAEAGGMLISYTGRSVSSGEGNLTGVPASGVGSLIADLNAGNTVTAVPFLTLSAGTLYAVADGVEVGLYVQRDDTTAQTTLAALEGGDGIHEFHVSDSSLTSVAACQTRGDAELLLAKAPEEEASYTSEDPATQSNTTITINVPAVSTTLAIQQVRLHWIPGRKETQREVTASSQFKTLYQYLANLQDRVTKAAA